MSASSSSSSSSPSSSSHECVPPPESIGISKLTMEFVDPVISSDELSGKMTHAAPPEIEDTCTSVIEVRPTAGMGLGVFANYCLPLPLPLPLPLSDPKIHTSPPCQTSSSSSSSLPSSPSSCVSPNPPISRVLGVYTGPARHVNVHAVKSRKDVEYTVWSGSLTVTSDGHWTGRLNHSHSRANVSLDNNGVFRQIRDIHRGEQILFDYGSDYWLWQVCELISNHIEQHQLDQWKLIYENVDDYGDLLKANIHQLPKSARIVAALAISGVDLDQLHQTQHDDVEFEKHIDTNDQPDAHSHSYDLWNL